MSQSPERTEPANPFDPFGLWKQSQQAMLESWSKSMNDAVNTEPYAETTGRMLDNYLTVSAPLRKVLDQTMTQVLNQLSLPSRAEVVSLAERMTNIELRLDDLDARLDAMQRSLERTSSSVSTLSALITTLVAATADASASADASNGTRAEERAPSRRRGSRTGGPAAARTTTRNATNRSSAKAK